ncbi:MAG: hypothetical protein WC551_08480 [Patescibacteria group bacterium]
MSKDAISISSLPDCLHDLKDGVNDLNLMADGAVGDQSDDFFTEEDFELLLIVQPDALEGAQTFSQFQARIDKYIEDHKADPRCQKEFGLSPESFPVYLRDIPQCLSGLRKQFIEAEKMASGGASDGIITPQDFKHFKRYHPSSVSFGTFWEFKASYVKEINKGWCSSVCDSERKVLGSEDRFCLALLPPVPPPPPARPPRRKPRPEKPKLAKSEPLPAPEPEGSPKLMELEGPPKPCWLQRGPAIARNSASGTGKGRAVAESSDAEQNMRPAAPVDPSKIRIFLSWSGFEKLYGGEYGLAAQRVEYKLQALREKENTDWHNEIMEEINNLRCGPNLDQKCGGFVAWNDSGMPVYSLYDQTFTFRENGAIHFMSPEEKSQIRTVTTKRETNKKIVLAIVQAPSTALSVVHGVVTGILSPLEWVYGKTLGMYDKIDQSQQMAVIRVVEPYFEQIRNTSMDRIYRDPKTYANLEEELVRIKRDDGKSLKNKHKCMFELWDSCLEMNSPDDSDWNNLIGQKARKVIEDFIRQHYPKDSSYAITEEEIAALNSNRSSSGRFDPYV